ncbi:MAG: mevalonate kinase [Microgenomates group bacterium]
MITYSSPAKVILSGEHAVVYGKPALVCAIDRRLKFTVFDRSSQNGNGKDGKIVLMITDKVKQYLKDKKIKFTDKSFDFKINSQIPVGRGLGSSAALSVAATAAFLKFYTGYSFEKETINNLAYQIEKHFHKNPSGVDNTASCFGGLIYYRREFEFLKNIASLNFKIPKKIEENLFLIDSGAPLETTARMVELVGKMYNKKPSYIEQILNDIEKTTKRMVVAIVKEDVDFFQQTLLDNEILLEILGVVSQKTKKLLKSLSQFGVGKITGAGGSKQGSGFILFYATDKEGLINFLKDKKISYFKFVSDYKGLDD